MADFVFELLFQAVFELLVNVVGQWGFNAVANLLRAKITRFLVSVVAGFGFGIWWGDRLGDAGHEDLPRLFYVTLAVAVAAMAGAFVRMRRGLDRPTGSPAEPERGGSLGVLVAPWRWDASRLASLALLNVAIAGGIDVGYSPLG